MKRNILVFLIALVVTLGASISALASVQQRDYQLRGYVNPLSTTQLPYRLPRLGVNAELTQYPAGTLPVVFDRMESAGVHWVRQFVRWDEIEPTIGEYDWSQWDAITAAIADTNLELVVVLMNTPDWARPDIDTELDKTAPPESPEQFGQFAATFAERYGGIVDYYQIWDEPNLFTAWGRLEPKPGAYMALLSNAYTAIHTVDPLAMVMSAALAPTTENTVNNINDIDYLETLYKLELADYSDAIAAKPYGFNTSPYDRIVRTDTLNFSRIIALREIMETYDDARTPLWASNWGWNSLPDYWQGNPSIWGSVTQDEQIQFTQDALNRAEREWPWLGGMILYHWQPDASPDDPVWGFALVDQNGDTTALLDHLIAINESQTQQASNGHYPPRTPFAAYSGVWTFSEIGADIGWQRDSRLSFAFSGTSVGFVLRKGDYVGYLYPQIDGQNPNALPQDSSGNSYIILTSGSLEPEIDVVTVATDLAMGKHTLTAVADRGFDQYALRGYAVSSGDLSVPFNQQITLAWIIALIGGIVTIGTSTRIEWRQYRSPIAEIVRSLDFTWQLVISLLTSTALMVGMLLTFGDMIPALFRRESVHLVLSIITAGLIYINPALVLTLLAAVVLFALIYNKLTIGLMLIVFYAPFFLFPIELFQFAFPMVEILTLMTFVAMLIRIFAEWGQLRRIGATRYPADRPPLNTLDYGIIVWVILSIISLTWAERTGIAITELRVLIIEPALFYAVFRAVQPSREDLLRIVDAFLLSGAVVALIGLFLYLQGQSVITAEGEARRLASVYGSPNNVALYLGRCIPFALAYVIRFHGLRRIIAGAFGIIMLIAVLLTQSVGGIFIGIPAGIATVLLLRYGKRAIVPLIFIAIVALLGFGLLASQSERFARALDFTQGTNFYRIRVWESALDMIVDHPITGVGLDQFLYEFRGTYIRPDAWQEPDLSHPHNIILDFWTRLGFFGVLLIGGLMISFWRDVRLIWRKIAHDHNHDHILITLIIGASGSMANLLSHGLIDNSVFVIDLAYVFMLLLAMVATIAHYARPSDI